MSSQHGSSGRARGGRARAPSPHSGIEPIDGGTVDEAERPARGSHDGAALAHCTLDARGRVLHASAAAAELLGAPAEALGRGSLADVVHRDDRAEFARHVARCVAEDAPAVATFRLRISTGERRVVEMTSVPVRDAEAPGPVLRAVLLDVTARDRAAREQRRRLADAEASLGRAEAAGRLKDAFVASVLHELHAPAAALLMWTGMLRDEAGSGPDRARAIAAIRECAAQQAALIDELADVTRAIRARIAVERELVAIAPLVRAAVAAAQPAARARGVALEFDVDDAVGSVAGDPVRLRQVIDKLLASAACARDGGARVVVAAVRAGAAIEIVVRSDGAAAPAPRGLAHTIAQQLVELHGGTLRTAAAGDGPGTAHTITLPAALDRVTDDEPSTAVRRSFAAHAELSGIAVLVVDEDAAMRAALALVLRRAGADVAVTGSAREAVELFRQRPTDVVIADVALPGGAGFALLDEVRAVSPDVRVVALSAHDARDRAVHAGFAQYLGKPIDARELIDAVARPSR